MCHRGLLLGNHLHGGFFFNDLLRHGSRHICWGCDGVPIMVVILILVVIILSCG
jgi:hypothetical protein